jgi:aminopeptidase N
MRSTYDLVYRHQKKHQVSSVGKLIRESEWPDARNERLTEFRIEQPVSMVTFAAGWIERHSEVRKLSIGEVPIDFYSLPSSFASIKEDFILAELGNALDYFCVLFGRYPYGNFRATFHPFRFGQGLPTLLLIPNTDEARRDVYAFISHETAHQWWGHIVAWRSYRDQWLSEGFAQYSGILYTQRRDSAKSAQDLIKDARLRVIQPPITGTGIGAGKVAEIGPLILGRRLRTRNSRNAYNDLVYYKGALVLRMLHFLYSDPSSGSGQPFYDMMSDFVKRFENRAASTEDFLDVANEHFVKTPIARYLGLKDLNWFFQQWVFEAKLPNYRMEYRMEPGQNGQFVIKGTVFQENAGENWLMPLPIVFTFQNNQQGRSLVYVNGTQTPFQMNLPMKPSSVDLDPDHWILSDKTSTKRQ